MTCGVFFQKICVFFPWVGLGSDDKHKDIVVSDSEGLHLTSIGFRFSFKETSLGWLVRVFASSSRVFPTDEENGLSLFCISGLRRCYWLKYHWTAVWLISSWFIYIYSIILNTYMHDIYVCFPHSFRIDKRQRKTFPPAILVSKKRPWNCAKTRRVFLRENDIGPLTRFFFGFEKSTVVEAIPFRAQRGASNRWTALFIRSILCRRRTKATWRSWRCEKKPSKTTFQPLWSALQHGFCTGLVTESPRKCAFNSCLGTIYSEFAQKSHPFFLRGGAGWGCGTLLAKCFVYFWPGFLTGMSKRRSKPMPVRLIRLCKH